MQNLQSIFNILSVSYKDLKRNDPLRLAAATAFFTTFALPPILIITIQFFASITNIDNLGDRFFERFATILGKESSAQVKTIFVGFKSLAKNEWITIGGFLFLLFVATTLFGVIKNSLNQLWSIKVSQGQVLKTSIKKRATSMLVILVAALLFIAATLSEGLEVLLGEHLDNLFKGSGHVANIVVHQVISIGVVTIWFAVLFKLLPDAKTSWRVVLNGGLFTAIFFTIGKVILRYLLSFGNLSSVFGASTSFVLLLLFVFYSSMIMYYGACYTNTYANLVSDPILPAHHSMRYKLAEVEINDREPKQEVTKEKEQLGNN